MESQVAGETELKFPKFLRHYTSIDTLCKIIDSRSIWCSHIRYLNDRHEFTHGLKAIVDRIDDALSGHMTRGMPELHALERIDGLQFLRDRLVDFDLFEIYLASFTTGEDNLSQWRAYGGSAGACIVFDGARLAASAGEAGAFLLRCFYDEENRTAMVNSVMKLACGEFSEDVIGDSALFLEACKARALQAQNVALKNSCLFKHPAFQQEQEWRIVSHVQAKDVDQLNFRRSGNTLVPYRTISLWKEHDPGSCPIVDVQIGPTSHATLNLVATTGMLARSGLGHIKVSTSEVPFRRL